MSMTDRSAQRRCVRTSSALSLALVAASLSSAYAADAEKPLVVRIAHGGPVSGPIAALGKDEENGVRMAIDELNARKLLRFEG